MNILCLSDQICKIDSFEKNALTHVRKFTKRTQIKFLRWLFRNNDEKNKMYPLVIIKNQHLKRYLL